MIESKINQINQLIAHAELMSTKDNYVGQINIYKRVLELDETNVTALINISDCFLKMNQNPSAERYALKAYQLCKEQDDIVTVNLSCIFIDKKDYASAISILEERKKNDCEDSLVYNNLGYAYHLSGQYIQALDNYTISILLEERNPLAYCNRGILKHKILNDNDGIKDLRKAELYGDYEAATYLREFTIDKTRLS